VIRTTPSLAQGMSSALTAPMKRELTDARRSSSFSPLSGFAGGLNGGLYTPWDITTLWQDSARTTQVTTAGQNVGCMDDVSGNGRNVLHLTLGATYDVVGGYPCLRFNGTDDFMTEAGSFTLSLPHYLIAAITPLTADALAYFGARKGANDYSLLINQTSGRQRGVLRNTALGASTATTAVAESPLNTAVVVDALASAGSNTVQVNNGTEASAVNTWTTETLTLAKMQLGGTGASGPASNILFFGGALINGAVSAAYRANAKRYFGRKIGLSL
jgi:hypothetical protein